MTTADNAANPTRRVHAILDRHVELKFRMRQRGIAMGTFGPHPTDNDFTEAYFSDEALAKVTTMVETLEAGLRKAA